jgi:hypothetical protein
MSAEGTMALFQHLNLAIKKSKAYICQIWYKTTLRVDCLKEGKKI